MSQKLIIVNMPHVLKTLHQFPYLCKQYQMSTRILWVVKIRQNKLGLDGPEEVKLQNGYQLTVR